MWGAYVVIQGDATKPDSLKPEMAWEGWDASRLAWGGTALPNLQDYIATTTDERANLRVSLEMTGRSPLNLQPQVFLPFSANYRTSLIAIARQS